MAAWLRARGPALVLVSSIAVLGAGCGDSPPAPPFDLGPRDFGGNDGGTDAMPDLPTGDMALDGGITGCTAEPPVDLFETACRSPSSTACTTLGTDVRVGAEANVDGVFVVASSLYDNYPFSEIVGAFFSSAGVASGPAVVHTAPGTNASAVAVTRSSSTGFLAMWDATGQGGAADVWVRQASASGAPQGTDAVAITSTTSGEGTARVVRTSSGYAASWIDPGGDTYTAVLDSSGAVSGSVQPATSIVGSTATLRPFAIAGSPRLAYLASDLRIHSTAIGSNGAVSASHVPNSLGTSTGVFAVAGDASGAGLVYEALIAGSRTEVRFRAINANGTSSLTERTLSAAGTEGKEPSIAPLAGGYLVVFRQVPIPPATGNAIVRLLVVGSFGDTIDAADLLDPAPASAGFFVRVSPDGEAYVVFQEPRSVTPPPAGTLIAGAAVRAIRLVCN